MDQQPLLRTEHPDEYEVIVVGGSFAGLSAALQLARARRQVLVVDAGKPRNRFAEASHGFLGHDGRAPGEILETARQQLRAYPTVIFRLDAATHVEGQLDGFRVHFANEGTARGRRLVLATGVTDHLPDFPGLRELWGTGVAQCPYCHGYELSGRPLAVLKTGKGSVHQALLLRDWSEHVTLLTHGSNTLTAEECEQLRADGIRIEEAPVARLIGSEGELQAVAFQDGRELPFAGLFLQPRVSFSSPLAEQLGCELEEGLLGPLVKTDSFQESTVPGVFVAGDAARAMHSVTFACAEGAMAGIAAHKSLRFPQPRS